jgi:hypothetical protein
MPIAGLRPGVYDAAMAAPAVCAWDGVLAAGICLTCGLPFCVTHQGRRATDDWLVGGAHWITYPDRCADCVREHDQRAAAQAAKTAADRRARQEWVTSLPSLSPEALLAYAQRQVDADDGVVSFSDESFRLSADPVCVATVLRQASYPGPFRHKAELGLPGRSKTKKITGWTVVRAGSYVNQDRRVSSSRGFMLTTDGLVLRVSADHMLSNGSPNMFFWTDTGGQLVTRPLDAEELEILREALGR